MRNCSKVGTQCKSLTAELAINYADDTKKIFNTSHIKIAMNMAISDAGATGNFLLPGTEVKNLKPSDKPLTINPPDGTQIQSTHTCDINVPWIPKEDRIAHIVQGMTHTIIVSIKVLIDAGCKVIYDKDN